VSAIRGLVLPLACLVVLCGSRPALAQSASRWFLAEGANNAVLEQEILVGNPSATDLTVTVTLLPDASAVLTPANMVLARIFPLKASSRLTVRVAQEFAGLNGAASAEVSAVLAGTTTPADIVVERSMYFPDGSRAGGHNASGVTQAAERWILAEGASGTFSTFILVANPNPTTTAIRVTYLKSTGDAVAFDATVPANSRITFWPQNDYPAQLGAAEFSTVVESTEAGKPIVAERAMYFDPAPTGSRFARSGHAALGVPAPSQTWYFAEGFTGGNAQTAFETFLLLANTNGVAATATVTYQLDSGEAVTRDYLLPPNQRLTVWVDQEGRTFDQRLRASSFGISVSSTRAIVAERSMYWGPPSPGDPSTPTFPWVEGHATAGSPVLSPRWTFAEGRDGEDIAQRGYSTFLLLSNPSPAPMTVRATFVTEDGGGLTSTVVVPARGRANIWPTGALPEFVALSQRRFATFLESTGGEPFVAERAMYWSNYIGGHVNIGTPWAGAIATPTRLPAPVTVTGFTPTRVRLSGGESITITGTGFSTDSEVSFDGLPMTVTSATATTITAVTPVRTTATGFGSVGTSRLRLTSSGATRAVGTVQRVFRVLAIGDSFTEGQLVARLPPVPPATAPTQIYSFADPAYPEALEDRLRADPQYGSNAEVDNAGFSGECAIIVGCSGNLSRGVDRIVGLVATKKFDVVIILEGFNDLNHDRTAAQVVSGLRAMGQSARASGATVLMGRIHVMRTDLWTAIRDMALAEMFTRVDFGTSIEIGTDNVHPTQKGYEQMANVAYSVIKSVIR